ncbi:nuclear transport factor 2 family protein [Amycolatopsis sp. NPDC051106]|uniref:nuclear transport factor 2 family protein n=1 Tax=unclassified Amycolatopsis TaxID=2618356 RepID=UPI003445CD99
MSRTDTPVATDPLTEREILAIQHLIAEIAFAFDSGGGGGGYTERLSGLLADDVRYENPGKTHLHSLAELVDTLENSADPAVSHHLSTMSVQPAGPGTATCRSKVVTFRSGGRLSVGEFTDTVRRGPGGRWTLTHRLVNPII